MFAARGFYRPHSGFPDWRPSADRQEVLDEALVWASKPGRTEVLGRLVEAGARVDADVYRGTALHMAAQHGRMEMVKLLVARGADRKIKDDLHQSDVAGWAKFFGQAEVRDYLNGL